MSGSQYFPDFEELSAAHELLLYVDGKFICAGNDRLFFTIDELRAHRQLIRNCFLVSAEAGRTVFALDLVADIADSIGAELRSLRSLLYLEDQRDVALAGSAFHILDWYRAHSYCGACGTKNVHHGSERVLHCPSCGQMSFPRINPCAIVLVTRGEEMLLAKSARRTTGFYSCLAGFIEIGETPEQTVVREVREEVGIEVGNVRYIKSQPWPFPAQLMLGYRAEYASGEIVLDDDEIADAKWFSAGEFPPIPSARISVAGELIEGFVNEVKAGKL